MKQDKLMEKFILNTMKEKKFSDLDMFIFQHIDTILEALNAKNISISAIYKVITEETKIDVSYITVYKKLNRLKKLSQTGKPAIKLPINHNDIEVVPADENQKTVAVDVNLNPAPVTEEPKKMSRREKLLAMRNRPDEEKIIDIQKDQNKFVWKPSIKE